MYEHIKPTRSFDDLVKLVHILRKECPWDRKQTPESIKDNLIEEAYEAVEAITEKDDPELKKELGDLMLHVIFQSRMAEEKKAFELEDVIYAIQEKLIRRHPHVFKDTDVSDEHEVAQNWESIKMKEGKKSVLDGVPIHLPALIRAQRMQEKAANVGFDWPSSEEVFAKLEEELDEFHEEVKKGDREKAHEEFGDLLFSLVNLARRYHIDAEDALRSTNKKFQQRFQHIEKRLKEQEKPLSETSLEEMDSYWNEAKKNGRLES